MIRLLARLVLSLLANTIGLLAALFILDGFSIEATSFIIAVLIFSIVTTVLGPFIAKVALTSAPYLMGGIALVTTLAGLIITALVTDAFVIEGLSTWVLATLIIWIFSIIGSVLLPLVLFKKTLSKHKKADEEKEDGA